MSFLDDKYEVPESVGNYYKFEQGENRLRILGSAITGWEEFIDNKPARYKTEDLPPEPHDAERPIKHFWAFPVWSYRDNKVQILEITQKGIQKSLRALTKDEDWGSPFDYDLVITRTGEKLKTAYSVNPKPHTPITKEIRSKFESANINLEALFTNDDPFKAKLTEDVDVDSLPDDL